ncbi:unnamed protein product [Dracunculus medinensis]|uniref:NDK domain-containing protein n=1 Tax=Dracunculus medinensis TaxID=318479 RepID=A0A0N4U7I8_DRAME|nr:unnamed protein product [Dracunculus medinensis]
MKLYYNGNAIEKWRNLMGPSKMSHYLTNNANENLRKKFALSDTRNVVHGADSFDNFNKEIKLFHSFF